MNIIAGIIIGTFILFIICFIVSVRLMNMNKVSER